MIHTIEWCEQKPTAGGKQRMVARLKSADGTLHENVTIWGDFPNFANLMNGGTVEGDIVPPKDPKYGPSLYPPKPTQTTSGGASRGQSGGFKSHLIEKAQDTKRTDIANAQENKNDHIRQAAAQRDAVLIVVNLYRERYANDPILLETELDAIIKKKIIQIRDWFLSTDFTNITPF